MTNKGKWIIRCWFKDIQWGKAHWDFKWFIMCCKNYGVLTLVTTLTRIDLRKYFETREEAEFIAENIRRCFTYKKVDVVQILKGTHP